MEAGAQRSREPENPENGQMAGWLESIWLGVVVGAAFGALGGLVEAGVVAAAVADPWTFVDLFGYAVLIDAAALGVLGGLVGLLGRVLALVTRRGFSLGWEITLLVVVGTLLVGGIAELAAWQTTGADSLASEDAPHLLSRIVILAAAGGCAAALGVMLAPRGRSARRALRVGRTVAPAIVVVLVLASIVGIVRDLNAHGFTIGAPAEQLALPEEVARPSDGLPLADEPAELGGPERPAIEQDQVMTVPPPVSDVAQRPAARPNVLLVTVDSLRADRLGATGHPNARTPTLDRLAGQGVLFARHYTDRNATTPAHASIFTGSYPSTHGVRTHMIDLLAPDVPTIAEIFTAHGYRTAGIFSWLAFEPPYSGLDRGFQRYIDLTVNLPSYLSDRRTAALAATYKRLKTLLALPGTIDRQLALSDEVEELLDGKADVTTDGAILWLRQYAAGPRKSGQPFFLWVHYWDPHYPYAPPSPFDQIDPVACPDCPDGSMQTIRALRSGEQLSPDQAGHLLTLYDGEIAFTDQELGRLLRELARLELDRDTVIVVVGDHGESFGELGNWLHGGDLYDPEIHVPLILWYPQGLPAGMTVEAVSQSIDVLPTILELVGLPIPPTVEGRTLLPLVRGEDAGDDRYAIAELANHLYVTIVTRDWQLLKNTASGTLHLYRAAEAPHPQQDWVAAEPDVAAELRRRLEQWQEAHP